MEGYIEKENRKKILLLADNLLIHSGVGNVCRDIVFNTSHKYNWIQVGAAINPSDEGARHNISEDVNMEMGLKDASVEIISSKGFGTPILIRNLLKQEKPDVVFLMGDPRMFEWLFDFENEIRKQCPIIWLTIWDSPLIPYYNSKFYSSCDGLLCISKQTKNLVEIILGEEKNNKYIDYIPHGVNSKYFYPIEDKKQLIDIKQKYFGDNQPEFLLFFNSRNIRRKSIPDLLLSWKLFCDNIGPEKASKSLLILHTDPVDSNGTDLNKVIQTLFGFKNNVRFSKRGVTKEELNILYNLADATVLPSSNEGWGLSLTESLMAGTMIIGNVTGGIQDQMRFVDEHGKWIEFNDEFLSNHFGKYKECGVWAKPVFPRSMSLVGSVQTPYIYDDRLDFRDLADAIKEVYDMDPKERKTNGINGRIWVESEESMMETKTMTNNISKAIDTILKNGIKRKPYELIDCNKIQEKINKNILY